MTYEQARIQILKAAREGDGATPATVRKAKDAVLAHVLRNTYGLLRS